MLVFCTPNDTCASVGRMIYDAMLLPFLAFSSLWPSVLSAGPNSGLPNLPSNGASSRSQTFSLSSLEWTLRNQNGSIVIPVRCLLWSILPEFISIFYRELYHLKPMSIS